jgi:hypothetical protein
MRQERIDDFDHLFRALAAGCPPHAGLAIGFDRLIAIMQGRDTVRDVIAFPKNSNGEDPMVKSPGPLYTKQLEPYHLRMSPTSEGSRDSPKPQQRKGLTGTIGNWVATTDSKSFTDDRKYLRDHRDHLNQFPEENPQNLGRNHQVLPSAK